MIGPWSVFDQLKGLFPIVSGVVVCVNMLGYKLVHGLHDGRGHLSSRRDVLGESVDLDQRVSLRGSHSDVRAGREVVLGCAHGVEFTF